MREVSNKQVVEYACPSGMRIKLSREVGSNYIKYLQIVGGTGQILTLTEAQAQELAQFFQEDRYM